MRFKTRAEHLSHLSHIPKVSGHEGKQNAEERELMLRILPAAETLVSGVSS